MLPRRTPSAVLHPSFNTDNDHLSSSLHKVTCKNGTIRRDWHWPAIATQGFACTPDTIHVVAFRIVAMPGSGLCDLKVGFTQETAWDATKTATPKDCVSAKLSIGRFFREMAHSSSDDDSDASSDDDKKEIPTPGPNPRAGPLPSLFEAMLNRPTAHKELSGSCYAVRGAKFKKGDIRELVALFHIGRDGAKTITWVVNGIVKRPRTVTPHFTAASNIFPVVCLGDKGHQVETIPLDMLNCRTPELKKLLLDECNIPFSANAPSTVLLREAQSGDFPDQLALKLRGDTVHVCLFGLADAGKSTVYNNILYVLHGGKFAGGRHVGAATAGVSQFSTQCNREAASFYLGWDVKQKGDLFITETVGFKGDESELFAIGNGKLKEIEAWPRDSSPESVQKRADILKRPAQTTRPTCFVLFIAMSQLINVAIDSQEKIVQSIIESAKTKFTAGEYQVEIPLIIVVTKVDLETEAKSADLLNQRTSPKLAAAFARCKERFGVSEDNVFAIGFLNETDVMDFTKESTDPRVFAVRHLILKMAEGAEIAKRRFKRIHDDDADDAAVVGPSVVNSACGESHIDDVFPPFSATSPPNNKKAELVGQHMSKNIYNSTSKSATVPQWMNETHDESLSDDNISVSHCSVSQQKQQTPQFLSLEEREAKCAEYDQKMSDVGPRVFLQKINRGELKMFLLFKNASEKIVDAMFQESINGNSFIDADFASNFFNPDMMANYKITPFDISVFNKMRARILNE